jgi:hypothetical protein
MKALLKLTVYICVFNLLMVAIHAQDKSAPNSDLLREQIEKLEAISLDGKSSSVQMIQKRALLKMYSQHIAALQQDASDLKSIQSAVSDSDRETKLAVDAQLQKLTAEETAIRQKMQGLMSNLQSIVSPELPARQLQSTTPSRAQLPAVETALPDSSATLVKTGGPVTDSLKSTLENSNHAAETADARSDTARSSNHLTTPASAQDKTPSTSFNANLNERIQNVVAAKINKRSNTKQFEAPSISGNSTSLVDQSAGGDLVNVALNFAGLSAISNTDATGNNNEADSVAVTASAYSVLAALKQVDPLSPGFYNRHSGWRRFSFTLGYDEENKDDPDAERAKLFGIKFLIVDKRDATRQRHSNDVRAVAANLKAATRRFGDIYDRVEGFLFSNEKSRDTIIKKDFKVFLEDRLQQAESRLQRAKASGDATQESRESATIERIKTLQNSIDEDNVFVVGKDGLIPTELFQAGVAAPVGGKGQWTPEERAYLTVFQNTYLGADYKTKLGQQVIDELDRFIENELEDTKAFENLDDVTRSAISRIRRAPQFSLYLLSKQRREGIDEYMGEAIFDYGIVNRLNLTLNGSFNYLDSKLVGGDTRGGKFSGQLQFQLTNDDLVGKRPIFFYLSSEGDWQAGRSPILKTQAKFTLPIADGFDLPLSVTYANRTELIDESTVKGQVGFSFDTARLIDAFLSK